MYKGGINTDYVNMVNVTNKLDQRYVEYCSSGSYLLSTCLVLCTVACYISGQGILK